MIATQDTNCRANSIQCDDFPRDVLTIAENAHAEFADSRCASNLTVIIARAIMADRVRRVDTTGLTTRQGECLRFISSHQEKHDGVTPSYREIAAFLGLSSVSGVVRLIDGLESRGRIKRLRNRTRAITINAND
jgi:LexA DNA binding domain